MSSNSSIKAPRRVKRKSDGSLKESGRWLLANQTGISFNLIALLFLTHACLSKARPYTSKFFRLSYFNPSTGNYAAGHDDLFFITFCIVLFTGLRAGFMEYALAPLARRWGLSKKKEVTRFSEQAWMLIYYNVFWALGMHIYTNSPYYLNMEELWTNWPQRELTGLVKAYILGQWAFWIQQVLVINMEDRRKDHWQMLSHHFVTIALISASYAYHQTRVGNLILVLMDVVDLIFPLAKCLKYLGYSTICDILFGVFIVLWFVSRHVLYMMTCWSIYSDLPRIVAPACYSGTANDLKGPLPVPSGWSHIIDPFFNSSGTVCWDNTIMYGFLGYLLVLQGMMILWSTFIAQVVVRVLQGNGADDVRSDGEDGEEEEVEEADEDEKARLYAAEPLEQEVGVEDIDLKAWERRSGVKRSTGASGVSLPGHSDRKELLNRIGCEKQID